MIRIVCVGKIKKEWKMVNDDFAKRIAKFRKLEIIEVKEKEAEKVMKYFKGFVISLDVKGKEISSEKFADLLSLHDKITFLIGGKEGIPEEILEKCDFRLSLSKMTFSHQLARIILLEQIYRAFCIIHNLPYSQ